MDDPLSVTIPTRSPGAILSTNCRAASLARGIAAGGSVTSSRISTIDRSPRSASAVVTAVNVSIGTRYPPIQTSSSSRLRSDTGTASRSIATTSITRRPGDRSTGAWR